LGAEVQRLRQQRQRLVQQIPELQSQVRTRDRTIRQRNAEISRQGRVLSARERGLRNLQTEISRRDSRIQVLDTDIAQRDRKLREGQDNLENLGSQLFVLQQEVTALEEERSKLRLGRVAIGRGDVLSFGVVRIVEPGAARDALDTLLRQANRQAVEAIRRPLEVGEPADERVVLITQAQVDQIVDGIRDGRDYVVRILSAGNYVEGDRYVQVFADVTPNEDIFTEDEVIATVSIEPDQMTPEERKERLDILLAASQFRARRSGILGDIVIGDGSVTTLTSFIDQLSDSEESFDQLKAIAPKPRSHLDRYASVWSRSIGREISFSIVRTMRIIMSCNAWVRTATALSEPERMSNR
ncbi:MAG: hypothetical protein HC838_01730, partial [Spirulinaceae cyanobacterium RM2_2_10]|nr:hypothetical protein [Spirulinaceae cyanobacterium RM2_2_10]